MRLHSVIIFYLYWLTIVIWITLIRITGLLTCFIIVLLSYILSLLNLTLCYQETLSLWSPSHFAHIIPSWLKWSLFFSVLLFFPFWSLLRLAFFKLLSQQWLQPTLLLLACANPQVDDTVTAHQDVRKYTCAFRGMLAHLAGSCHFKSVTPNSYQNLTNKEKFRKEQRTNREKWLFYKMNRGFFFFLIWHGLIWGKEPHSNK